MDWPSSSWLFIRVGAFFSSFSYTNSSSRTSADGDKKTQLQSHKTTVRQPSAGGKFRTASPKQPSSHSLRGGFYNDTHDKRTSRSNPIWLICYMLSHHVNVHWQSQQSLSAVCCMQVEQIQFTIAKTVTHHCEQQLVRLVFVVPVLWLLYSNMALWCEQRRMHSWAYRLHRHPINRCV